MGIKIHSVHDDKALFKDVRREWWVIVFVLELSSYTGLQSTT